MMKRKDTLLGRLGQNPEGIPQDAPDFPPGMKVALIAAAVAGTLLVAYALLGFFFAPWLIQRQLLKQVDAQTLLTAEVEKVGFNPFTLKCEIRGLELVDEAGEPVAGFGRAGINLQVASLFRGGPVFKEIRLEQPVVHLVRDADGTLNVRRILAPAAEAPESPAEDGPPPYVGIDLLEIVEGRVSVTDRSTAQTFQAEYFPISFSLVEFSTRGDNPNRLAMEARSPTGGTLVWTGSLGLQPLRSSGDVVLQGLEVHNLSPYYTGFTNFDVRQALGDVSLRYRVDLGDTENPVSFDQGEFSLREVVIHPRLGEERVISLDAVTIHGATLDLLPRRLEVDRFEANGGSVLLVQNPDSEINLVELLRLERSPPPDAPAAEAGEAAPPWNYRVGVIRLRDYQVQVNDQVPETPLNTEVLIHSIEARELTQDLAQPVSLVADYAIGGEGALKLEGSLAPAPLDVDLKVEAASIPARLVDPYLSTFLDLEMQSGTAGFNGRLTASAAEEGSEAATPVIGLSGDLSLEGFSTVHRANPDEAFSFSSMNARGLEFRSTPARFAGSELVLADFAGTLVRQADGSLLLPTAKGPASTKAAPPADAPAAESDGGMELEFSSIRVENGAFRLVDEAVTPRFEAGLEAVQLSLEGVSNTDDRAATLQMEGVINETARLVAEGRINLLEQFEDTDLNLSLEPLDLTFFNPYAGKYLGRKIQRGKLEMQLDYAVRDRVLDGSNHLVFDQIALGDRVESADAVNLPLDLAIGLLRNRQGVMEIDLPVQGNLDDPNFRLGNLIFRAFSNLIAKAATAPFSILGGLVASDRELSHVMFEPGSVELAAEEAAKLKDLAMALDRRPSINLELFGLTNRLADTAALRRRVLPVALASMQERFPELPQGDFSDDAQTYALLLSGVGDLKAFEEVSRGLMRETAMGPGPGAGSADGASPSAVADTGTPATDAGPRRETVITREERVLQVGEVAEVPGFFDRLFGGNERRTPANDPITVEVVKTEVVPAEEAPQVNTPTPRPADTETGNAGAPPMELPPVELLERAALARIPVDPDTLNWLARQREKRVADLLKESHGLSAERLFVVEPPADAESAAQVRFELR